MTLTGECPDSRSEQRNFAWWRVGSPFRPSRMKRKGIVDFSLLEEEENGVVLEM